MRSLILLLCLGLFILSCKESNENNANVIESLKATGKQIPVDVAERWVSNYNSTTSQVNQQPYNFSNANLKLALNSVENLTGAALHHGTDSKGNHHIILIPVDESLNLFAAKNDKIFIDANTNKIISAEVAQNWATEYKKNHANLIWFHFFGSVVFNQISKSNFSTCQIKPGLNDKDEPQLILFSYGPVISSSGRVHGGTLTTYDLSSPCPMCAVK